MNELIKLLSSIPDAYDDFILGTLNYAKRDPAHIEAMKQFMLEDKNITTSDVITFIM